MGQELTLWTIRAALLAYVASVALRLIAPTSRRTAALARWAWIAASLGCLAHVACAFHFHHHWSHAEAYRHVAERTRETIGWDWGGGLYVNYVFVLVWLGDAIWWWVSQEGYLRRSRAVNLAVHLFLLFIIFNATVVFGNGWVRWLGVVGVLLPAQLLIGPFYRSISQILRKCTGSP